MAPSPPGREDSEFDQAIEDQDCTHHACLSASTLDDLIHLVLEAILSHGDPIRPSKGPASELTGILLELVDPRARLSRTEVRGKPFSSLGELCWYLAGSNDLNFISYYIHRYKAYADGEVIFGGYGPRLFKWKGVNQFANVIELLKKKPDSRQAVIQLFDSTDIVEEHNDIPCTCTLQFLLRSNRLHMLTSMRSTDVYLGLPHDIFCFTMLQEITAKTLSADLGTYKHVVGSLHLYDINRDNAQRFLDEGWQSTEMPMPQMPSGDPWPAIHVLLKAESAIRAGSPLNTVSLEGLDPYWVDFIRLLQAFRYKKDKMPDNIRALSGQMSSPIYSWFMERLL